MINENVLARKKDLLEGIEYALKGYKCSIRANDSDIKVRFSKDIEIGLSVEENGYRIYNISEDWAGKTTYFCEKDLDGIRYYYLDSIDECIGEIERIADVEIKKVIVPIVNDGTLLSVFGTIKDQYPEFIFTNINAKGEKENRAVYIYNQNASRKHNVAFEIWRKPKVEAIDLYIKREFMTNEEYEESSRTYGKTTATRGRITRYFKSNQELIDFMVNKLNLATKK